MFLNVHWQIIVVGWADPDDGTELEPRMSELATTGDYILLGNDSASIDNFTKKVSDKIAESICSEKQRVCSWKVLIFLGSVNVHRTEIARLSTCNSFWNYCMHSLWRHEKCRIFVYNVCVYFTAYLVLWACPLSCSVSVFRTVPCVDEKFLT